MKTKWGVFYFTMNKTRVYNLQDILSPATNVYTYPVYSITPVVSMELTTTEWPQMRRLANKSRTHTFDDTFVPYIYKKLLNVFEKQKFVSLAKRVG